MARNITLALDEEVIRKAKVVAARRGVSLSALLREQISRLAEQDEAYDAAHREELQWLAEGASLGTGHPRREELHDRDALR